MQPHFLLYGSSGFVGSEIARIAVEQGLQPILAGRSREKVAAQAARLGVEYRVFGLDDAQVVASSLADLPVVLHCAGPFMYTYKAMLEGCLQTGVHYLDITGEIPVYQGLSASDARAKSKGVMIMPGVGFDVVPTDCLALHLKQRLPEASQLTLAFHSDGPAGLPPGTARTSIEMIHIPTKVRRNGELVTAPAEGKLRSFDFGSGPRQAVRMNWGDIFTAFHTTGIPNIQDYVALRPSVIKQMSQAAKMRPLLRLGFVRGLMLRMLPAGSTPQERASTRTHVWGQVQDDQGNQATARLHGPEAGVVWTAQTALASVRKVLAGEFNPGFQTPASVFGADFVMENEEVTREDLD